MLRYVRGAVVGVAFFIGSGWLLLLMLLGFGKHDPAFFYARSLMPRMQRLLGIRLEIRHPENLSAQLPCVFVANHQTTLDLFVHGTVFPPGTLTVGKKSLRYIPIFGLIFVLSRCILIDRGKHKSALESMAHAARELLQRQKSVWVFAEGTRSGKRGLLPFKKGAFHLAVTAQRPIVPVVASSYYKSFDLGKWRAGTVLVEALPPVPTAGLRPDQVPELLASVHADMKRTLDRLNEEITLRRQRQVKA